MEAANQQHKAPPKHDDLRQVVWLPLILSGTGSALGAVFLLASGSVPDFEKRERLLFPVLVGGVSLLYSWLIPNVRSEARLAWGLLPQRTFAAMVRLVKEVMFGMVAGLAGYVLWFVCQLFTLA